MKILWVSLVEFPPLSLALGKTVSPFCGWLYASAKAVLAQSNDIQLGVAVYSYGKKYEEYEVDGIHYYLIPTKRMTSIDSRQVKACQQAIYSFQPDLIHIYGTEHSLAQAICKANRDRVKIVVNIQGLAGAYVRYADGGLNFYDKLLNITPLDFYRNTFLFSAKRNMRKRAECENKVLLQITDIIGRTQWDHDHVLTVNPNLQYHFLNETLRNSFYEGRRWSYQMCKRHTIFVSNSREPLKGAHQMLKALPIILHYYPDVKVYFCGSCVMNNDIKSKLRFQGYHLYLRRLVKRLKLQTHVCFLGILSEQQMKQAFLDANVYVMPSAIENSPNSLCEAQILGVPVIASYCGGVSSLMENEMTGYYYRYEEYEMLAYLVIRLFKEKNFLILSQREQKVASVRHDREKNAKELIAIYKKLSDVS